MPEPTGNPPGNPSDKRRSVRLEINAVTRFTCAGVDRVGMTKLINLGGVLMEVDEALALGSELELQLNLPSTLEPFKAKGEVVYRHNIRGRSSHAASEMGIKFVELKTENEAQLRDFTARYQEFNLRPSVFSKEMSAFHDPSILPVGSPEKK